MKTVERLTQQHIADILVMQERSFDAEGRDLRRVQRYLRGGRTCMAFDALDAYTQDLIEAVYTYIERDPDLSRLYND